MATDEHHDHPDCRTVRIPGSDEHDGHHLITITLRRVCPVCGGPRGVIARHLLQRLPTAGL